jgi:hypothetical protein
MEFMIDADNTTRRKGICKKDSVIFWRDHPKVGKRREAGWSPIPVGKIDVISAGEWNDRRLVPMVFF